MVRCSLSSVVGGRMSGSSAPPSCHRRRCTILPVGAPGHGLGAGAVGDGEGEDEEREEERDEGCHGEEVGGQEALAVPVAPTKPASTTRRRSPPRMATGQRARRAHSAPCLEANQRPVATTGTVQEV